MTALADLLEEDALYEQLEYAQARKRLSVYAGLHIPAEIEADDLPKLHQLDLPARYIPAQHHRLLIEALERVESGEIRRLMVFMPPRAGKSMYCSVMFPAWYLGRHPTHKIIQGSYNDTLASRFGKRARNAFASDIHRKVFGFGVSETSRAVGEWETAKGGEYFSFGVNTGVTGRPATGAILDDLIRGRQDADSVTIRDKTWETYMADVRTRLERTRDGMQPWIVYAATRWHFDDPAGRILPPTAIGKTGWFTAKDGEKWYVITLPAVIETQAEAADDALGRRVGEHLWPEWWDKNHFAQEKRSQSARNWTSLYQQKPSPDEGGILKREFWQKWPDKTPPKCEYVLSMYDTAFEEGEENDFTARTHWGVFWNEDAPTPEIEAKRGDGEPHHRPNEGRYCVILLGMLNKRMEFPELRKEAKDHYNTTKPDRVMVEKKASGMSLLQELRRAGVPASPAPTLRNSQGREANKIARAHAVSVVLEQWCVYYMDKPWAEEVIAQCAAFPAAANDDLVDTCTAAWLYLRRTFHLNLRDEEPVEENDARKGKVKAVGYGAR